MKDSTNSSFRRPIAFVAGLAVAAGLFAAPAQGSTYTATGKGAQDRATTFEMDVDAKAKGGKLRSASSISRLLMEDAAFSCSATGYEGRSDYSHMGLYEQPVKIKKNGSFNDVYERVIGDEVITRYTLKGKVAGKGKSMLITGTFQAEMSEGGLKFNNCSTGAVAFKVQTKL